MKKIFLILIILFLSSIYIVSFTHAELTKNENIYIDLSWTCDSYVPNDYQGKALPSGGSSITVSAMPYFKIKNKLLKNAELNFKWFVNDEIFAGNGPEITFNTEIYRALHEVQVIVSAKDDSISSQEWISIKIKSPEVQIYEYNENFANVDLNKGFLEEINTYSKNIISLIAIPYFFNTQNISALDFKWQINNTLLTSMPSQTANAVQININTTENSFEKNLLIKVSNKQNLLESSVKNIILKNNE